VEAHRECFGWRWAAECHSAFTNSPIFFFLLATLLPIMKNYLLLAPLALLLALPGQLRAQEFRQKFNSPQNRKVVLDMRGSDVTVEGYDGDELLIRGKGHYEAPPALANGLRPIYSGGASDNTRLGLSVTQVGDNTIRVTGMSHSDGHYTVQLPRQTNLSFDQTSWGGSDDLTIRDLAGRIEVSLKSGDLRLLNVSGPVVANTISGDIKVQFSATPSQPSAVTSVSGDVDVSLPPSAKVSLSMRSISGEIYTDFDLNLGGGSGLRHVGGQTVEGRANGGGTTFSLKTISGDIYVRKSK
jgi:lia operon protein LiaG